MPEIIEPKPAPLKSAPLTLGWRTTNPIATNYVTRISIDLRQFKPTSIQTNSKIQTNLNSNASEDSNKFEFKRIRKFKRVCNTGEGAAAGAEGDDCQPAALRVPGVKLPPFLKLTGKCSQVDWEMSNQPGTQVDLSTFDDRWLQIRTHFPKKTWDKPLSTLG